MQPIRYTEWYKFVDSLRLELLEAINALRVEQGWWRLEQLGGWIDETHTEIFIDNEYAQMVADILTSKGINFTGSIRSSHGMKFTITMREHWPQVGVNYWSLINNVAFNTLPLEVTAISFHDTMYENGMTRIKFHGEWEHACAKAEKYASRIRAHFKIEALVVSTDVCIYREMQIP
jgi:hypothetical protein